MATDKDILLLLDKVRSGDRTTFDELCREQKGRLESFIRSRMGGLLKSKMQPEDILQETLLRAFQCIHVFRGRGEGTFYNWLASISEHLIWSVSQKHSLRETPLAWEIPGGGVSASKAMRRRERLARLERSLSTLKPDQREVLLLSKIEGLRVKEIAERIGRSEEAVRQLLSRGLRALRQDFGDTESLHLPNHGTMTGGINGSE